MKLFQWISRSISIIIIMWNGVYGEMTCDIEPDLQEQCQLPRLVDEGSFEQLCLKHGCCYVQGLPSMYRSCYKKVFRYERRPLDVRWQTTRAPYGANPQFGEHLLHGGETGFPGNQLVKKCHPLFRGGRCFPPWVKVNKEKCERSGCCWSYSGCYKSKFHITYLRKRCPPGFKNPPRCEAKTPSLTPPTAVTDCTPQPPEGGYIYSETGLVTFPIHVIFEYRCNDGATLVGIPRNMCLSNGQLAVKIPTCKAKTPSLTPPTAVTDCTPQPPEGGYIYSETGLVTFPIHVIFEYRCNDGATLVGIPRNMCLSNGQLAVKIPTCKEN